MKLDQFYEYVNITSRTKGDVDAAGEASWTWAAVESNVKADIQALSERELKATGPGKVVDASHRAFFENDITIAVGDRVEADDDNDGVVDTYYRVVSVDDQKSHIEALLKGED